MRLIARPRPPRHRLSGPGAQPEAAARFADQLSASPRSAVDPDDLDALRTLGWPTAADAVAERVAPARQRA